MRPKWAGIVDLIREAQLHRDVYIAVFDSALRMPGSKGRFAASVGITPRYLSYLLNPDELRTPSPRLARLLARALPIDDAQRAGVLEHMLLANERMLAGLRVAGAHPTQARARSVGLSRGDVDAALAAIRQSQAAANYSSDPAGARWGYQLVREMAAGLLSRVNLATDPLAFADLCLTLYDVESVLNRPDNALYYARYARLLTEELERNDYLRTLEWFDNVRMQSIIAESVSWRKLNDYKLAYDIGLSAENEPAIKQQPGFWLPHVYNELMRSAHGRSRFYIREVEERADTARAAIESRPELFDGALGLLIERARGMANLAYGREVEGGRILLAQRDAIDRRADIGPLRRVMLLRSVADVLWRKGGDCTDWKEVVAQAARLAIAARLAHQVEELRREYGEAIEPILEEARAVEANGRDTAGP